MSINKAIMRRKLGLDSRVEIDFAVNRIRLKEVVKLTTPVIEQDEESMKTFGPLACSKLDNSIVAVANEDGYINLLKTTPLKNLSHWLGHGNAIFDVKSSPDCKTIMTASGDGQIKHWNVETKTEISTLSGHHSTVKSLSFYDNNTLASGSRDGCIKIHDLRRKRPTIVIRDAHRNLLIGKNRKSLTKTDPISCVTNVVFDTHFPRLYSTGANDAAIKLWDLRGRTQINKPRRSHNGEILLNQPYLQVNHPSKGKHCGYSHLLLSAGKVYAACSDNKIYCYENFGSQDEPVKYTGYRYDTYLRISVMDDRFLFSGAKGGGAMMWTIGNTKSALYYPEMTKQPVGQLKLDESDRFDTNVVETDWDSLSVLTFRDDRLVCKWTMNHVLESERKKLITEPALSLQEEDVAVQMSDIINVNVLRSNQRVMNTQIRI